MVHFSEYFAISKYIPSQRGLPTDIHGTLVSQPGCFKLLPAMSEGGLMLSFELRLRSSCCFVLIYIFLFYLELNFGCADVVRAQFSEKIPSGLCHVIDKRRFRHTVRALNVIVEEMVSL